MQSMTAIVLVIGATALLSALVTASLILVAADRLLKRRLAGGAEQVGEVVAGKVRSAVEDAVDEALPRLRAEVSGGVREGATEVLPEVRREVESGVSDGISEALASAVTGGVFGKAGEELVRKGGSVLDVLLGSRDKLGD